MSKATVKAEIEPELKKSVETILDEIGITTTQAITMYYKQIQQHKGIPFAMVNKETLETFAKTDSGQELTKYNTVDDIFNSLDHTPKYLTKTKFL